VGLEVVGGHVHLLALLELAQRLLHQFPIEGLCTTPTTTPSARVSCRVACRVSFWRVPCVMCRV
jgi:hypothetical protein